MAKNENSNFSYMTRRIGGTTYKVKVVFSDTYGIMETPQMSRQSERSAS